MIDWGFQVVDNVPNRILGSTGLIGWANHLVLVPVSFGYQLDFGEYLDFSMVSQRVCDENDGLGPTHRLR
jgi:hypothetical protein